MSQQLDYSHIEPADAFHDHNEDNNASLFQLGKLQIARPMRAWERKPISPFHSKRSRAKKIWKRIPLGPRTFNTTAAARATALGSEEFLDNAKAVKRRCISTAESISTQWEAMESPVKRITTRSSGSKDLVALENEEDIEPAESEDDVDGTITEIIYDDGTTTIDRTSLHDGEWLDAPDEERYNLEHLEENNESAGEEESAHDVEKTNGSIGEDEPAHDASDEDKQTISDSTAQQAPSINIATFAVPEGFATPMKRHRSMSKRLKASNRRQTLPHAFAPELVIPSSTAAGIAENGENVSIAAVANENHRPSTTPQDPTSPEPGLLSSQETPVVQNDTSDAERETPLADSGPSSQASISPGDIHSSPETEMQHTTSVKQNLRRSPRRKSTSPMKIAKVKLQEAVPHIVAFSPVKKISTQKQNHDTGIAASQPLCLCEDEKLNAHTETSGPRHVESEEATPELMTSSQEMIPQTPPAVASKHGDVMNSKHNEGPRLSDDTALLQAFLERAAQNKTTPVVYAEDADVTTSPQIMPASPAAVNVLGELDPNAVSPRRAGSPPSRNKSGKAQLPEGELALLYGNGDGDNDDLNFLRAARTKDIRRSDRNATTAPAKITLRGLSDHRTVKRTPAQELFLLTARNTRANKDEAIPPSQRIPELMVEMLYSSNTTQQPVKKSGTKKSVAWNKNSTYFTLEPYDETEDSHNDEDAHSDPQEVDTAPLSKPDQHKPLTRQATPSKPRAQRLRTPTAVGLPSTAASATKVPDTQGRAKLAKPSLVGPSKLATQRDYSKVGTQTSKIAQASTRRKVQSRLPAPVTTVNEPAVISATLEGNTLMMSPPKRAATLFIPMFEPSNAKNISSDSNTEMVGLSSPAKRPRKQFLFGVAEGQGARLADALGSKFERPILSSPAKKRAKRPM